MIKKLLHKSASISSIKWKLLNELISATETQRLTFSVFVVLINKNNFHKNCNLSFNSPYALFSFCADKAEKNSTKMSAMLSMMWFSRCLRRNFLRNLITWIKVSLCRVIDLKRLSYARWSSVSSCRRGNMRSKFKWLKWRCRLSTNTFCMTRSVWQWCFSVIMNS